jgi:hypothetical protein
MMLLREIQLEFGFRNAEFGRRWEKKRARRKDRSGEDGKM